MLEELRVRNLALIEEAWLEFGPGMTVLTGETGAGKTALLGALKLLLGERADSGTVRAGATESVVEGRFTAQDAEMMVRRRVSADGRSRCTVDGELSAVGELSRRVGPLVDLHGQHEHQALLTPATHVGYLDRWAGVPATEALLRYREARVAYRDAVRERDELSERIATAAADADYLTFVAGEIDRIDPKPGEDAVLAQRLPALQHAGRLAEAASIATEALRGEGGAIDRAGEALRELRRLEGIDESLDEITLRLAEVVALADDVSGATRAYRDSIDHDPAVLQHTLDRLSELAGLTKKYGPTLDDVFERRATAQAALLGVDDSDAALLRAEARAAAARTELEERGGALTAVRESAAPGFESALSVAAGDLAMSDSRFEVRFTPLEFASWTDEGASRVDFLFTPAAAQPARPLAKIASGGELSRVMLALKGVLGSADCVETLVFDEVDAGIGGATAIAVGRRLKLLSQTHQVIVVTHLAQVAAFADRQLVVSKAAEDGAVTTAVRAVTGEDRIAEVARMLSGNDSHTGHAHARELLAGADVVP